MEWMKVEKGTPAKREIAILARFLKVSIGDAFLSWFNLYAWADEAATADGFVPHLSVDEGDTLSKCIPGTCAALASDSIGWILIDTRGITFVNFDRHNGKSSKQRTLDTERKRRHRGDLSQNCPDENVTKTGPEKRREDIKNPLPPEGEPTGFEKWWNAYPDKRTRKHSRAKCLTRWNNGNLESISDLILATLQREKASSHWSREDGRFIPAPAKWLERASWEARPAQQQTAVPAPKSRTDNGDAIAAREELQQRSYLQSLNPVEFDRLAKAAFDGSNEFIQRQIRGKSPIETMLWRGEMYRISQGGAAGEPPPPGGGK